MGRPSRRGRVFFPRGQRGGNATVRNVSWAEDVDKDYDRSIGYVEQLVNLKKSTNISQVREGGDGGNEIPLMARGRGDRANETENLGMADGLGVGIPVQAGMLPHALPGQMIPMSQTPPVHFNGQAYVLFVGFVEFSGKNCFKYVAMFHCRIFSITRALVARYGEVSCDLIRSVLLFVWFIWYFQLSLFLHFNCD